MSNDVYNPSVDLTIFPRINHLKEFGTRAARRDLNGRIFLPFGVVDIDTPERYPASDGSTCMASLLPFPVDLGPSVLTAPTSLFDLRDDCGAPTVYDLNPLN